MLLQNHHFVRKGFPLILLFQKSVEVGVGVFECFFKYQTSLGESGKAAAAPTHGVRHSAMREVQTHGNRQLYFSFFS